MHWFSKRVCDAHQTSDTELSPKYLGTYRREGRLHQKSQRIISVINERKKLDELYNHLNLETII